MNDWIIELGMEIYHVFSKRIILGDLENAFAINSIILITKKAIYNTMKKEQKPIILIVRIDIKNIYFQGKYRLYINDRGMQFEKQYLLLSNIYVVELLTILYL